MIGEEVRRYRQELRLTGAQLAARAGMAPSAVSQIETGKRIPSSTSVMKLAEALGVEVAELFPKAQAQLPLEDGQLRPSVLSEAVISTVDKWISYASAPETNDWKRFGIADAASALGVSIEDIIERADGVPWESLSSSEQHEIMRVMEKITEVIQSVTQHVEDELLEEGFKRQREKIREWTQRISA